MSLVFPEPELGEEDGLLAVGGDLSLERLVLAYSNGIFPWYNPGEEILWWCPKDRFIIRPENVHISKTMKRVLKNKDIKITYNENFYGVISNCKEIREHEEGTWITDEMRSAYVNLHKHALIHTLKLLDKQDKPYEMPYSIVKGIIRMGCDLYKNIQKYASKEYKEFNSKIRR